MSWTGAEAGLTAHDRRDFLMGMATLLGVGATNIEVAQSSGGAMYGLIGKMMAVSGQRDALAKVLLEGTAAMPGCLSYVVAADPTDPDALWITEVWENQARHQASLQLPSVQAAIAKGRPLIAGFGSRTETSPLGGHGLG